MHADMQYTYTLRTCSIFSVQHTFRTHVLCDCYMHITRAAYVQTAYQKICAYEQEFRKVWSPCWTPQILYVYMHAHTTRLLTLSRNIAVTSVYKLVGKRARHLQGRDLAKASKRGGPPPPFLRHILFNVVQRMC